MAPKVLVSDKLSQSAVELFKQRGVDVDFLPDVGKDKEKLLEIISQYDGLAIRSATKVTEKLLDAASQLKVVGRAGIGVDNVDVPAASRKGVIVMNTPFGNSITTAEHSIAMMMAVARQIPAADSSTQSGKWEKSRFMGVELTSKVLGLIGCGNIGAVVADRAKGLKMRVIAYDPYLSEERAGLLGVEKVELEELLARADFISLHVPLTDKTRMIISKEALAKTKPGVRLVNCARGGLIDEEALAEALKSGHVAGAAIDVFATEPATENVLFHIPNVVATPHLGASTMEAQENVAVQVAEQMSDYLLNGAVVNALNMPAISAEEAPIITPWVKLAEHLGSFVGQVSDDPVKEINILFNGDVAELNTSALTSAVLTGFLKSQIPDVNMVSALIIAKERGIKLSETTSEQTGVYESYIKVYVKTERSSRSIAGTVFSDKKPRFIQIKDINLDADVGRNMLYTTNEDVPGVIGTLGAILGDAGLNIANFNLGREAQGGDAIALLYLDSPADSDTVQKLVASGKFQRAVPLQFEVD